jgi:Type IV secretion-system coupling protein DNA-binding domain
VRDILSRVINTVWSSGLSVKGLGNEMQSIARLKVECDELASRSPFHDIDHRTFVVEMMLEACELHGKQPHKNIRVAMCETIDALMVAEGIVEPDIEWERLETSFSYQDIVRRRLDSRKQFFSDYDKHMEIWRRKIVAIFHGILGYLSDHAFTEEEDGPTFEVALTDAIESLDDVLDRILLTYEDEDFRYPSLAREVRETFVDNMLHASGIDPKARAEITKRIIIPSESKIDVPKELVSKYMRNTPFDKFFTCSTPFVIPEKVKNEHSIIIGGSGHGKTQLMQRLIFADIEKAKYERRSIVVIDSQGDLIHKLSRLKAFDRNEEHSLFNRVCLIDPNDIDYPISLNIFDINRERIERYGKAEREKILNGTIELYENFFGSLLGAELTQKQGVIFKYLARLMLKIPNANIHTLRDLMDNAEPFVPYMEKLKGSARYFFEREFFDRSFGPTKKQIAKRLWGVLATPSFERMFAQPRNKVDMFELLNSGSIILINTAKDLLKQEGCELFGRFFLSMISQAAMERSAIREEDRTPTTIYIDEAQEYFDDNVDILLTQGRKQKIAIVCGNQTLDQLTPSLRASFMSNTSTKIVGGLSSKDASAFASEMHTTSGFLQSLKKRQSVSEFALYVRHHTAEAIRIEVPLGFLESQDMLDDYSFEEVRDESRLKFGAGYSEEEEVHTPFARSRSGKPKAVREVAPRMPKTVVYAAPEPEEVDPEFSVVEEMIQQDIIPVPDQQKKPKQRKEVPPAMGRGGRQHRYLQELIKGLAEGEGYLARIEDEVLDGGGFIDVSLAKGEERIACEIAITTPADKEIENIKKCFAAGYELVWVVAPEQKHLNEIRALAESAFTETQRTMIVFLRPEDIPAAFSNRPSPPMESTVRGYRVRVKRAGGSFDDTQAKRATVAEILAKSVQGGRLFLKPN